MPTFATFTIGLPNNVPVMVLPVFGPPRVEPLEVWSPTLGGPNTGSVIAGALLGNPVENVAKVGTVLPLPY